MRHRLALVLVVAALLAPTAAADSLALDVVATRLDATDATGTGPLALLLREVDAGSADFHLQAGSLSVGMDEADPTLENPLNPVRAPATMSPANFTHATVTGTAHRDGHLWHLFPLEGHALPSWRTDGACLGLTESPRDSALLEPMANTDRPDTAINLSDTLAVSSCGAALRVTVEGALCLSLWEWDAALSSQEGRRDLRTGRQPSAALPGVPVAARYVQAFLCSEDARLDVTLEGGFELYAAGHSTVAAAAASLEDAYGVLGRTPLRGDVVLEDGASLTASAGQGGVAVQGEGGRLSVDGATLTAPSQDRPSVAWLLAGLALVLVAAVGVVQRRRRSTRANTALAGALKASEASDWSAALAAVTRSLRLKPHNADAHTLRAYCLTSLGRNDEALLEHEAAHRYNSPRNVDVVAQNAIEAARTLRHLGRMEEALAWLDRAFEADAGQLWSALERPDLASLKPRFAAWRGVPGYS